MSNVLLTPLGGVNQVGQNCILYTYEDYSVVVDCGVKPLTCDEGRNSEDNWREPPSRLDILDEAISKGNKAIGIITHAHRDHIGAVRELSIRRMPTFLSKTSKALMETYARELKIPRGSRFITFDMIANLKHGKFDIVLIPLRHSIPGTYGALIRAGNKTIFHLSDFKFNGVKETLGETRKMLQEVRKLGKIDCLVLDVLNAELPGFTPPEQQVFDAISDILKKEKGRVVITLFSSNIDRIRGILEIAGALNRKVCFGSLAMMTDLYKIRLLETLEYHSSNNDWDILLAGGSQGEIGSGLERMARGEHDNYVLHHGDTIIFSARCIPGNEGCIRDEIENLHSRGARIYLHYGETKKLNLSFEAAEESFLHVSGHEQMGGLQEAIDILKPGVIIPFHAPKNSFETNRIRRLRVGETLEI